MRLLRAVLATSICLAIAACHSAMLLATVRNSSNQPVTLIEVDYPSASFGVQRLAPGEQYAYRFKVIGSGPTTLIWTDATGHEKKSSGPQLREGDEGTISIMLNSGSSPTWTVNLKNRPT